MYAIIQDSGTQFMVRKGDVIDVDTRPLAAEQQTLEFDRVLMLRDDQTHIGRPTVDGAKVTAEVVGPVRGDKIHVVKFKRRDNYRRKKGHRQNYLRVRVTEITGGAAS